MDLCIVLYFICTFDDPCFFFKSSTTIQIRVFSVQETEHYAKGTVRFAVDGKDSAGTSVRIVTFKDDLCRKFSAIFKVRRL